MFYTIAARMSVCAGLVLDDCRPHVCLCAFATAVDACYSPRHAGANAAACGLIATAVFQLYLSVLGNHNPFPLATVAIGIFGYTATEALHLFEPLVIALGAILGLIAWAAGCH